MPLSSQEGSTLSSGSQAVLRHRPWLTSCPASPSARPAHDTAVQFKVEDRSPEMARHDSGLPDDSVVARGPIPRCVPPARQKDDAPSGSRSRSAGGGMRRRGAEAPQAPWATASQAVLRLPRFPPYPASAIRPPGRRTTRPSSSRSRSVGARCAGETPRSRMTLSSSAAEGPSSESRWVRRSVAPADSKSSARGVIEPAAEDGDPRGRA